MYCFPSKFAIILRRQNAFTMLTGSLHNLCITHIKLEHKGEVTSVEPSISSCKVTSVEPSFHPVRSCLFNHLFHPVRSRLLNHLFHPVRSRLLNHLFHPVR